MPADLAADLMARFAPRPVVGAQAPSVSWTGKIRTLFATPRFGMIAATAVVIGVAIPMLTHPDAGLPETFRGGGPAAVPAQGVRIVVVGGEPRAAADLRSSGNFEVSAISTEATTATASTIAGPKVVVDFTAGTITAVDSYGTTVHQAEIPSSDVSAAVADAISRL